MERGEIINRGDVQDGTGMFATGQLPYEADGVVHFPASGIFTGLVAKHEGVLVQLHLVVDTAAGNQVASFMRMTPEGARIMAQGLIENAQKVEAYVADQAAAAIEAARKGGAA
jgi:hypothetical protein